ncbi:RNA polymerase sigma factor [Emticicia sp. BO119]|uniref:RNA polymerase sigma factor n=1 Tax=Emticicia sp. BO119 TaxID=2757768 RepID=UPI0015F09B1E|nr:sigma-70 family RNA polymerase sigma factor [Emticicia sp. BO119]MBA4852156.1 sigma-70 family RNA polymerase sigma factor [Emticicia sp. BO119]
MQELQLIQELQKQNPFVQKRVYDRFVKRMFRLCLRYVKFEADAQELLMNGFLKFFNSVAKIEYRGENTLEPYLKKLMVNECLMFIRQRKMDWVLMEEITDQEPISDFSAYETFDEEVIYQLVLKLPDGYRTVFNLYAIEGFSHKEIAAQLRISENTSKTQLFKARLILQAELTKLGYNYGT